MALKTYKNGAFQDITTLKTYKDGAWQEADHSCDYRNGAWQNNWENYTPPMHKESMNRELIGTTSINCFTLAQLDEAYAKGYTKLKVSVKYIQNAYIKIANGFSDGLGDVGSSEADVSITLDLTQKVSGETRYRYFKDYGSVTFIVTGNGAVIITDLEATFTK